MVTPQPLPAVQLPPAGSGPSKTLTVPGKQWDSAVAFLKDFPGLALPVFFAGYMQMQSGPLPDWMGSNLDQAQSFFSKIPAFGSSEIMGALKQLNGPDQFTIQRRIQAQLALITNAISPGDPISTEIATGQPASAGTWQAQPKPAGIMSMHSWGADSTFTWMDYIFLNFIIPEIKGWMINSYLSPGSDQDTKNWNLAWTKSIDANMDNCLAFFASNYFTHFIAQSQDEPVSFSEVMGIVDPAAMQPDSISYVVVKDYPTTDPAWQNVNAWSKVMSLPQGMALLNAAAENEPVMIKALPVDLASAKNSFSTGMQNDIRYASWDIVYNDFVVTAYPNNKLIVQYIRYRNSETVEIANEKDNIWITIAMFASIALVAAAAVAVSGAAVAAGSSTAAASPDFAAAGAGIGATGAGATGVSSGVSLLSGSVVAGGSTISGIASAVKSVGSGVSTAQKASGLVANLMHQLGLGNKTPEAGQQTPVAAGAGINPLWILAAAVVAGIAL